jgi:hypothetical protein
MNTKHLHSGMIASIIGFLLIYLHYIQKRPPFDSAGFVGIILTFPVATALVSMAASELKKTSLQGFNAGLCGVRIAGYVYTLWVYLHLLFNIQTNERWIICVCTAVLLVIDMNSLGRLRTK